MDVLLRRIEQYIIENGIHDLENALVSATVNYSFFTKEVDAIRAETALKRFLYAVTGLTPC